MWLSPKQISERYGISTRTVTRMAAEMEEMGYKLFRSRIVRIKEEEFEEFIRNRRRKNDKTYLCNITRFTGSRVPACK